MKIPKSFHLLNREYEVKVLADAEFVKVYNDGLWDVKKNGIEPGDPIDGATFHSPALIILNKDRHDNDRDLWRTFLHELVHAFLFADGMYVSGDHDERVVDRWANMIDHIISSAKGDHKIKW